MLKLLKNNKKTLKKKIKKKIFFSLRFSAIINYKFNFLTCFYLNN